MIAANALPPVWNPFSKEYAENPHIQQNFFREHLPVHKGINHTWMLFRYDDVKRLFTDERFINIKLHAQYQAKTRLFPDSPSLDHLQNASTKWLLFTNPPEHTQLRRLVMKVWNRIKVSDFIEEVVHETVAHLKTLDEVDLVQDFAFHIPVKTILHVLGLPQKDMQMLRTWGRHFIQSLEPFESIHKLVAYDKSAAQFYQYIETIMEAKRNKPDDSFISGMMQENESCDEPLTHNELISVFILVFFAGIETSVYLIAQGLYYLMLDEKSMAWFRENPGLSGKAVEELIRFSSPSQYAPRVAATDILVQDQLIKKGDKIMGCIASANRDPRVFENPDSLMLDRQKNPHLGFGFGMHHCIGAKLAREEMNLLFPALLSAFHTIQFHPSKKHVWDTMIINRGLHSLPAQLSW